MVLFNDVRGYFAFSFNNGVLFLDEVVLLFFNPANLKFHYPKATNEVVLLKFQKRSSYKTDVSMKLLNQI